MVMVSEGARRQKRRCVHALTMMMMMMVCEGARQGGTHHLTASVTLPNTSGADTKVSAASACSALLLRRDALLATVL